MKEYFSRRQFIKLMGTAILGYGCSFNEQKTPEAQITPIIENKLSDNAYLYLPFKESELINPVDQITKYDVTEGWIYSDFEQKVHGFKQHNGVDIAVNYGTRVYAPTDGYAMSSYASRWLYNSDGRIKTYQNIPMRFGLGYFVQIYNPDLQRYILMGHLSDIPGTIPFSTPALQGRDWIATNQNIPIDQMEKSPLVTKVKRGDLIGFVGYSGLGWGYEDYFKGANRPVVIDPEKQKNWDEPHIHFEEYLLNLRTNARENRRCIYDIYNDFTYYPTPLRYGTMGANALLVRTTSGLPAFTLN